MKGERLSGNLPFVQSPGPRLRTHQIRIKPVEKVDMNRKLAAGICLVLGSAVMLGACGGSSNAKKLRLVAYSTPQAAFASLIPAFEATPAGKGVGFSQSYGPSGDQSRAVLAGLPADVVDLSLEPDVTKLVKAGLVPASWNANATHGFVTNSVAVFIVRKGNPKHLAGWADLVKPGVEVLTPNPFSSGSARWNVMAAYGAELKEGRTPAEAQAYLTSLFHHVVSQDTSARNATQTFLAGKGDVLIGYENEAIADERKGAAVDHVVPRDTILIQNPVAVLTRGNATLGKAFVDYLLSPAGQRIWASKGYRPVVPGTAGASAFPTPAGLFTIDSLGGWTAVTKRFFDPSTGVVTKIEQSLGVSTAK
jgi:sulfate transport system substrate-binding protein